MKHLFNKPLAQINSHIVQHIKPHQWGKNLIDSLKPRDAAEKVYMLGSLMYVPSAVLTPVVTHYQLKSAGIPKRERHLLVSQEWMRQSIGAAIHFLSFFGGIALFGLAAVSDKGKTSAKYLEQKARKAIHPNTIKKMIGSITFATLGNAWLRPTILNRYVKQWFDKEQAQLSLQSKTAQITSLQAKSLKKNIYTTRPNTFTANRSFNPNQALSFSRQQWAKQGYHFATPHQFTPFFG